MRTYSRKPIEYEEVNGCFICTSHCKNPKGYHMIAINRQGIPLHRHIYEQHKGKIPEGLVVRHKCDVRSCINPEHLELGTVTDNNRDRMDRGRGAVGENHARSKLTNENVREIRSSYLSHAELSRKFNVDPKVIRNVRNYVTWKHVKDGEE